MLRYREYNFDTTVENFVKICQASMECNLMRSLMLTYLLRYLDHNFDRRLWRLGNKYLQHMEYN